MKFYLNGTLQDCAERDANTTLLQYLRQGAGKTGTKEGCASGDCGACTVLVADCDGAMPRSINSCITPLGALQGRQVVTVEGLAAGAEPHPVQQAMVACHGSQCGFCTPGFVMSLAGLYQRCLDTGRDAPGRGEIVETIAGNLCRCTGYRPIVDAAGSMMGYPKRSILGALERQSGAQAPQEDAAALLAGEHRYYLPRSEESLREILRAEPAARLVAGGTDLMLEVTQRFVQFPVLVDISGIASLAGVVAEGNYIRIGAATLYRDLLEHPLLDSASLANLLQRLGSQQIRNRGTLGGNIANASPIADMPPVLLAWQAEVAISDVEGATRWLPLEDFYLDYRQTVLQPGQYLSAVRMPKSAVAEPHRFYKLSKRYEDDISSVMCALSMTLDGRRVTAVRIAYGGMAAVPKRAVAAENVLRGALLDDNTIAMACAAVSTEFQPLSDVRASAAYRLAMAAGLLQRGLLALRDGDTADVFAGQAVEVSHA
ncbi:xanthine dehydrogenase small subunit [Haliea sp. E17]|uniref:xanthine dehydrogenase small subunit n=1 Tax=Haliea sp. E17 TaxID=3401576 RepID=UPI003AAA3C5A